MHVYVMTISLMKYDISAMIKIAALLIYRSWFLTGTTIARQLYGVPKKAFYR
jgi:hypothetical protein